MGPLSDFELAKAEESIAKNKANKEIVELITSEAAYEAQEEKDIQNLLIIDYVYNNSKENGFNSFEANILGEKVTAYVEGSRIVAKVGNRTVFTEITEKLANSKISKESRDYLAKHYSNTMYKYGNMYYILQKNLGKAVRIKFKDLRTGKKTVILHENGKPVSNSLRCVTPGTSVEIEFTDKYGKSMYLTMPGIKNVERAIEKIKEGGKYDLAYREDTKNVRIKYASQDDRIVQEVDGFIKNNIDNKIFQKDIVHLNEKYTGAVLYYLSELNNIKLSGVDKRKELEFKKEIHNIGTGFDKNTYSVIETVKKVSDVVLDASKYDKGILDKLNEKSLISRYLSELEDIVDVDKKGGKNKRYSKEKNAAHKDLLESYYKILGGNSAYISELASVRNPQERLKDIFRCAIITRYYDNITNIKDRFNESLKPLYTSDKFYGNKDPRHKGFKNSYGYRDDKVVYEKKDGGTDFDIGFETQFKIATLGEEDLRTHEIYSELRALEEELRNCYDKKKVESLKRGIIAKKIEIRNVYGHVLDRYNTKVLETAAEMEIDLFRKEWKEKLDIPKDLETLRRLNKERAAAEYNLRNGEVTVPEVEKFIKDNLLVSPFKTLNIKENIGNIEDIDYSEDIVVHPSEDVMIIKDEVETKADMKSFAMRYYHVIKKAYIGVINGELPKGYYNDYDKALEEKAKQNANHKTIRGSEYYTGLTKQERKSINREESAYLKETGKEKVAGYEKKGNNGSRVLINNQIRKNLQRQGK